MYSYRDDLLTFSKDLLHQFVLSSSSVAIGVVDFASDATVISTLSTDVDAVRAARAPDS